MKILERYLNDLTGGKVPSVTAWVGDCPRPTVSPAWTYPAKDVGYISVVTEWKTYLSLGGGRGRLSAPCPLLHH